MSRNELSKVASLSVLAAALLLVPGQADAGDRVPDLCSSVKGCTYTNTSAPVLDADVCWNRVDIRLKGAASCPTGSWAYHVGFGEVIDPILGSIVAYVPLKDACDLGYCIQAPAPGPLSAEPLCCNSAQDDCVMYAGGYCSAGSDIVFCEQAATNDDGTISCHD